MTISAEAINEIAQLADTASLPTLVYGTEEDPHVSIVHLTNHHGLDIIETIDFEKYKPHPRRKKGTVDVYNVDSFVNYVKRHMSDATEMFAKGQQVVAVLNHHSADTPGWNDHRCVLTVKQTPAWSEWLGFTDKYIEQEDFAQFLEDHISAIAAPAAGDVLDLTRSLKIHSKAEFHKDIRPGDGTVQITFTDTHTTSTPKGAIDFKDGFPMTIVLTPFEGGEEFEFQAKLRYKLREGELSFCLVMPGVREAVGAAIENRIGYIEAELSQHVLRGALVS